MFAGEVGWAAGGQVLVYLFLISCRFTYFPDCFINLAIGITISIFLSQFTCLAHLFVCKHVSDPFVFFKIFACLVVCRQIVFCFKAFSVAAESLKWRHVSSKCSKNQYSMDCRLSHRITFLFFSYLFLSATIFLFSASERLLTSASKTQMTKTSSSSSSLIFFSIFSILLFSNRRGGDGVSITK